MFLLILVFILIASWFSFDYIFIWFSVQNCVWFEANRRITSTYHTKVALYSSKFSQFHMQVHLIDPAQSARCVFIPRSVPQQFAHCIQLREDSVRPAANFVTTATWPSAGDGFYFYYSRRVCSLCHRFMELCSGERSLEPLLSRWQRWLYYFLASVRAGIFWMDRDS